MDFDLRSLNRTVVDNYFYFSFEAGILVFGNPVSECLFPFLSELNLIELFIDLNILKMI